MLRAPNAVCESICQTSVLHPGPSQLRIPSSLYQSLQPPHSCLMPVLNPPQVFLLFCPFGGLKWWVSQKSVISLKHFLCLTETLWPTAANYFFATKVTKSQRNKRTCQSPRDSEGSSQDYILYLSNLVLLL